MAEHDDEHRVSTLYRGLPSEEPPAALDDAIRAEARRAALSRPAPLVAPTGRRSWHYPTAAAAVLVLAVAVTWHVEREQPDMVAVVPQGVPEAPASPPAPAPTPAPQAEPRAKAQGPAAPRPERQRKAEPAFTPDPAPGEMAEAKKDSKLAEAPAAAASAPATPPPAAEQRNDALAKQQQRMEIARDAAGERAAGAAAPAPAAKPSARVLAAQAESPEAWLERIARMRGEGKHDEADKALAEFRKRYPDFKIPAETLEKVERR